MKVEFELSDKQKLILHMLLETGTIDINLLKKFLETYIFSQNRGSYYDKITSRGPGGGAAFNVIYSDFTKDISGLKFLGLINVYDENIEKITLKTAHLTDEGKRIASAVKFDRRPIIRPEKSLQKAIFVASVIGNEEIDSLYDNHYAPACSSLGYNSIRIDLSEPPQTITDAILDNIKNAACIIGDLTYARPSVYFEVGFALALGLPILLCCRKDHYRGINDDKRVHFDLEQFKISFWSKTKEGLFKWKKEMEPINRLRKIVPKLEGLK